MDVLETNLIEIANSIFKKPPQGIKSIQLELEETSALEAEGSGGLDKTVCDIVLFLTINGIEILFGHRDIMSLTQDQYELVCEYTRSYGYDIAVYANKSQETVWDVVAKNGVVNTVELKIMRV